MPSGLKPAIKSGLNLKPFTIILDNPYKLLCVSYKISPQDILVICDDFDLNFGTLRYRAKGTSGGNNGLKSITDTLHTTDFPRLRLGSNNQPSAKKLATSTSSSVNSLPTKNPNFQPSSKMHSPSYPGSSQLVYHTTQNCPDQNPAGASNPF